MNIKNSEEISLSKNISEMSQIEKDNPQLLSIKRNRYEEINTTASNSNSKNEGVMNLLKKCYHCQLMTFDSEIVLCIHDGLIMYSCSKCCNVFHVLLIINLNIIVCCESKINK